MSACVISTDLAGRAYSYQRPEVDRDLVECSRGTLAGELLRRYWQPIARSEEVAGRPRAVRILGEDLVLFRDKSGTPGLLYPRCMHRGTSLLFGRLEQHGIRCPYHGWQFDAQGRCVEAPFEAAGVAAGIRQPWYPVAEKHGLLWTYMGPAERQPDFPRMPLLEGLSHDEEILVGGSMDPPIDGRIPDNQDFSWWQSFENLIDPLHVYVLHSHMNGVQFGDDWALPPEVWFERRADGVVNYAHRQRPDGSVFRFTSQGILPNINCSGEEDGEGRRQGVMIWQVPRDETSYRVFSLCRRRPDSDKIIGGIEKPTWGPEKLADSWTIEDHQTWQNDYTVLKGQGDVQTHKEQHLTLWDRGVASLRTTFLEQAKIVRAGGDPVRRDVIEVCTALNPPPGLRSIPAPLEPNSLTAG